MNTQIAFLARLRRQRQRQGVSLDEVARQTRVKRELFEAFENNDLSDWPRGLYARAWIRGYAIAVGLDPADTVDEFCRLYLHGDRRARATMHEMAAISSAGPGYQEDYGREDRRRGGRPQTSATWLTPVVQRWRMARSRVAALWALYFVKPRSAQR
jgi:transcriptional regulator with XRE-family HTH domain